MAQAGATVHVRVQPKASRSQVLGFRGDVLQVRVTAPPERGKANAALLKILAASLGTPRSTISIVRGQGSRDKLISVGGMSLDEVRSRLQDGGKK